MNVFAKMPYAIQHTVWMKRGWIRHSDQRKNKKNRKTLPKKATATIFSTQNTKHKKRKKQRERKREGKMPTNMSWYGLGHLAVKGIKLADVNINNFEYKYKCFAFKNYVRAMYLLIYSPLFLFSLKFFLSFFILYFIFFVYFFFISIQTYVI